MARDNHIDQAELIEYANHFIGAAGAVQSVHPIIQELITEQTAFRDYFLQARAQAETSRSGLRAAEGDRRALSEQIAERLRRLFNHLVAIEGEYTFDFLRFFPNRAKGDIGESLADRQRAAQRCLEALKAYPEMPKAAEWTEELTGLVNSFDAAMQGTAEKSTAKSGDTKELAAQYAAWKGHYLACRYIARGILKRAGREAEWRGLFLDLLRGGKAAGEADGAGEDAGDQEASSPG